jgi:oligosaccharide repeat unit polymerase
MIASKLLALLFSLAILGTGYVVRRAVGTWLVPACLFALTWFFFTVLPLVSLWSAPINPWAVAYIWVGTMAFALPALIRFRWREAFSANRAKPSPEEYFNTPFLRAVFRSAAIVSIPCFLLNMRAQGFVWADLTDRMFETATTYSVLRYTEALVPTLFAKAEILLAYIAITTGGLLFGSARRNRQRLETLVGGFSPAIAAMLWESAKGLLFFFIVLFFGGVLVTRIFRGKLVLLDRATRLAALTGFVILVPLTIMSFFARGLYAVEDSGELADAMLKFLATYAVGHLYAFSDWFSFHTGFASSMSYEVLSTGYGFFTFTSLFRLAGSTRFMPLGNFDDVFLYKDLLMTNIYTLFRALITDFGMVGGLVCLFVVGAAAHLAFHSLLTARRPTMSVSLFVFTLGGCYMSFVISMFTWNIVPVVIVALAGVLFLNCRVRFPGVTILPSRRRVVRSTAALP